MSTISKRDLTQTRWKGSDQALDGLPGKKSPLGLVNNFVRAAITSL